LMHKACPRTPGQSGPLICQHSIGHRHTRYAVTGNRSPCRTGHSVCSADRESVCRAMPVAPGERCSSPGRTADLTDGQGRSCYSLWAKAALLRKGTGLLLCNAYMALTTTPLSLVAQQGADAVIGRQAIVLRHHLDKAIALQDRMHHCFPEL